MTRKLKMFKFLHKKLSIWLNKSHLKSKKFSLKLLLLQVHSRKSLKEITIWEMLFKKLPIRDLNLLIEFPQSQLKNMVMKNFTLFLMITLYQSLKKILLLEKLKLLMITYLLKKSNKLYWKLKLKKTEQLSSVLITSKKLLRKFLKSIQLLKRSKKECLKSFLNKWMV